MITKSGNGLKIGVRGGIRIDEAAVELAEIIEMNFEELGIWTGKKSIYLTH